MVMPESIAPATPWNPWSVPIRKRLEKSVRPLRRLRGDP